VITTEILEVFSREVLKMISDGTTGWAVLPSGIAEIIKSISFWLRAK
jgi:hypothetical protein